MLGHYRGTLEVTDQVCFALNAGVGEFADFFRVEAAPAFSLELFGQDQDALVLFEVDEGVADVAPVLEVDWQI